MSLGHESFLQSEKDLNKSIFSTNEELNKSLDSMSIVPVMQFESEEEKKKNFDEGAKEYRVNANAQLQEALLSFSDRLDDGHSESYIDVRNAIRECGNIIADIRNGTFTWNSENYRAYNRLFEAVARYVNDHVGAKSGVGKQRLHDALTIKLALTNVSSDILKKEKIRVGVDAPVGDKKQIDAAKENLGRFMGYYREYCKRIGDDLLASDEEKIRRRWNVLKSCEQDILMYIEYRERKGNMSSDDRYLKSEYFSLRNQMLMRELATTKGEKNAFKEDNLKTIKKHEKELNKKGLIEEKEKLVKQEDGLTKKQIAALSQIDTWVVRNFRNGGYMSMFGQASDRTDILGRLFSMNRRKRLYVYYLVETRQRVQPTAEGLICSQLGYEPDLDTFKGHMVANKLKFYARFSGGYVYWNKLTEAIAIAEQATPVLTDISEFLEEERKDKKENRNSILNNNKLLIRENEELDLSDLSNVSMDDLVVAQDVLNKRLMGSAIEAIRQLQSRNRDSKDKNKAPELRDDDVFIGVGEDMQEVVQRLAQIRAEIDRKKGSEASKKKDVQNYAGTMPKDLVGVAGVLQLGLGDVMKNALSNGIKLPGIDIDAVKNFDFKKMIKTAYTLEPSEGQISDMAAAYKGGTQALNVLGNLVGMYFIYKNLSENYSSMNRYDVVSNIGDMGLTAGKTTQAVTKILQIFKGTDFLEVVTSKTANVALAGVDCAVAITKGFSHHRNYSHRSKASTLARQKQGSDKFRDGMVKLNRKLGRKQKTDTSAAMTTALLSGGAAVLIFTSVISAGAAPLAGLIVGAASFGIGILKRFISNKFSKDMKMELFDNFFKIDKAVRDVKAEWRQKNHNRNMTADQENRIVNQVRRRIAANLGFYSPTHASKALAVEYAKYLLDNARNGGGNSEMCKSMIQGLGLQFKTNEDTGDIIVPTQSDIIKKLCG